MVVDNVPTDTRYRKGVRRTSTVKTECGVTPVESVDQFESRDGGTGERWCHSWPGGGVSRNGVCFRPRRQENPVKTIPVTESLKDESTDRTRSLRGRRSKLDFGVIPKSKLGPIVVTHQILLTLQDTKSLFINPEVKKKVR